MPLPPLRIDSWQCPKGVWRSSLESFPIVPTSLRKVRPPRFAFRRGASFASAKNGLRRLSLRSESSTPRPGGLGDEMVGPCFASFGDSEVCLVNHENVLGNAACNHVASLWLQWRMGTGAPATALAAWRRAPRGHNGVDQLELGSHSVEGAFKGRVNFMTPDTAHWHFNGAGYGWRRFTGLRGTGKELSKTIRMCFSIFTGKTRLLPATLRRQQHE